MARAGIAVGDSGAVPLAWSVEAGAVCERLGVDPSSGLGDAEIAAQRARHGDNALRHSAPRGALDILLSQLRSFIVALLVIAVVLSLLLGQLPEAIAVFAVICINTAIGFTTELRAVRSMEALRALGSVHTTVRRRGRSSRIPAQELVVGDVVLLEAGDVVTADLRLLEGSRLRANESTLTGESVPVEKGVEAVAPDAPLAERTSMLFKGTAVTQGAGVAVVVAVGMSSELGRISTLMEQTPDEATPLEERLEGLGRALAAASLGFVVLVAGAGLLAGRPWVETIETAIALAVAAVPEGLPIVATVALARGMWRMARQNALIEHLPAVETLGSTNVILTDKTGTLTENRMTVTRVELASRRVDVSGTGLDLEGSFETEGKALPPREQASLLSLLTTAASCTDAELSTEGGEPVGDPMEVALLVAAAKAGVHRARLQAERPELRADAFAPETRMMATYHDVAGSVEVAVKGSPEAVLAACDHEATGDGTRPLETEAREQWSRRFGALGAEGLRVLAVAAKTASSTEEPPYQGLTLLGLIGLVDPPRREVRASVDACHAAGIRVIMVTGDQPDTARYVAREVGLPTQREPVLGSALDLDTAQESAPPGLLEADVIARCSPEQKLRLIELHQRAGAVVAMVGDGVNDAPALRRADIGVAMGLRGTQVAREAADMVLQDDRFATIPAAIHHGRVIFDNIRAFVLYLVSCNLGEILVIGVASLAGAPLPILPLQILFLNLLTDVFPALALGVSEGRAHIMERPPRDPGEAFLTPTHWVRATGFSLALTIPTLVAALIAHRHLGLGSDEATTVSFLVLAVGQLAHVFNMAQPEAPLLDNRVTRNPWVWASIALCVGLLLLAVHVPWLSQVLRTRAPDARGWLLIGAGGLAPFFIGLLWRALARRT